MTHFKMIQDSCYVVRVTSLTVSVNYLKKRTLVVSQVDEAKLNTDKNIPPSQI